MTEAQCTYIFELTLVCHIYIRLGLESNETAPYQRRVLRALRTESFSLLHTVRMRIVRLEQIVFFAGFHRFQTSHLQRKRAAHFVDECHSGMYLHSQFLYLVKVKNNNITSSAASSSQAPLLDRHLPLQRLCALPV